MEISDMSHKENSGIDYSQIAMQIQRKDMHLQCSNTA